MAMGLRNGGQLVALAAGGTAAVFFAMAGHSTVSKQRFRFHDQLPVVGRHRLMLAVVAIFSFPEPGHVAAICGAFVLFSSAMILWQVSQIVHGGETNYVSATLTL